jgi:prepilin-type N-terminal cleavage/methylation domain-containing protein
MLRTKPGFTLVELLVVIGIILLLACLMLPFQRTAREASRRNQCLKQLKQIALGALNYNDTHNTLPPEFSADEAGGPLHSWRTLLLPFLEESQLDQRIDHQQRWDTAVNNKVRKTFLPIYMCPSYPGDEDAVTTYRGCAGPEYVFNGSSPRQLLDISDGRSKTVLFIDEPPNKVVEWMSPVEFPLAPPDAPPAKPSHREEILSRPVHPGVLLAAFADGHAKPLKVNLAPEALHALKTIAGNEQDEY